MAGEKGSEHPVEALLGPELLKEIGPHKKPNLRNFRQSFNDGPAIETEKALANKDLVLLYFSAAWCPPCRSFSPLLKDFYKAAQEDADTSRIEIIYVSSDRDAQEFANNFQSMPWLALQSQHFKSLLSKKCHIQGIPTLVVLNAKNGYFVTDQARGEVTRVGGNKKKVMSLIQEWKSVEAVPLEEATFSSGGGCAIL